MRKATLIGANGRASASGPPSRRKTKPASSIPAAARLSKPFPVVGIGTSAGGLEAATQLLKHLPPAPGLALVLVQHLHPARRSALSVLLSRATSMPVSEARNNLPLEPNRVYVVPPNRTIALSARRLKVSPRRGSREVHRPIDHFLESLAEEEGVRAIGVILSGSGSDGTRGLIAVKAAGGMTFAQDEASAQFHSMPASAIAAGCVDFVLPPEQIASELARVAGHPFVGSQASTEQIAGAPPAEEKAFAAILTTLGQRTGVDFTHYKPAKVQRHVQRRMVLHKFESLREYADHLRADGTEFRELFNDILLRVSGFFRDASLFRAFRKKVFPALLNQKAPDDSIRIWVPGCSTGEEVYSIAIALVEFMGDHKRHHPVQIFATDIHVSALEKARAAVYVEAIKADVSTERLRRFFLKTEGGYRVSKAIREMCIFARQDVAVDPPFPNLDLISCRNVLTHMGAALQRKVIPLFHYALQSNGFLVLGATETVGGFSDLFALRDRKVRSYIKKPAHFGPAVPFSRGFTDPPGRTPSSPSPPAGPSPTELQRCADRILLARYCPAGAIIDRHMVVLDVRGCTDPFLSHTPGRANRNLIEMARASLRADLRAAVTESIRRNARVLRSGVRVQQKGYPAEASIEVIPYTVPRSDDRFYLVVFQAQSGTAEATAAKNPRGSKQRAPRPAVSGELARLKEELAVMRESLQSRIEEREVALEELRSANEEITSGNEELQAANEELETAKEELQSTNEELITLNDELTNRNTELEHVSNDLRNVLGNVNMPILILGPDLRIRRFAGGAEKMFGLTPSDVGRPISDLNLDVPDLPKLVVEAIDHLTARELEVKDRNGRCWSAHIRPYQTIDNRIEGAIIAWVEIDLLGSSAERRSQKRLFADALINALRQPVLVPDETRIGQPANQPVTEKKPQ
jgi:two-component system CheB/CheR fusion protein